MFHRLDVKPNINCGYVETVPGSNYYPFLFINGRVLADSLLPSLCRFTIRSESETSIMMDDFYPHVNLMSARLVSVLQTAGASNLQIVPAEIQAVSGGPVIKDYVVVNIVGLVACAVQSQSEATALADSQYFFKLKIDPLRAGDLPIFRLAESKIDVIVNEVVAQAILSNDFPSLTLMSVT